jgi:hypothetical protein
VWRASALSVTIDEAYTFNQFVAGGFTGIFLSGFDANNHVLHSALVWLSTSLFGISEFGIRIPALLGTAGFLYLLPALIERVIADRRLQLLTIAVLILNPLTIDLLCAARGYSLALAFMTMAVLHLLRYADGQKRNDLRWVSASLGLMCSANLSFAFAAIAILGVSVCVAVRREQWRHLLSAFVPVVSILFVILVLPFSRVERSYFYWGSPTIRISAETTTDAFLLHNPHDSAPFGSVKTRGRFTRRYLPIGLGLILLTTVWWFVAGMRTQVTLLGFILAICLFGYWLAHEWLQVPYPSERTSIPLVLLFFLTLGGVTAGLLRDPSLAWRTVALASIAVSVAMLIQFAMQFRPGHLWSWYQERDNRQIADLLRGRGARNISSFWVVQPALEFYRLAGRMPAAKPLLKYPADLPPLEGYDAYVLLRPDQRILESKKLRIVWKSEFTGVSVAVPNDARP